MPINEIDEIPVVSEGAKQLRAFIKEKKAILLQKGRRLSPGVRKQINKDIEDARSRIPFQEALEKGRWRSRINGS